MNNKNLDHFMKPFSELCTISEDEKIFKGVIRWNIPKPEIRKYLQKSSDGKSIESNTFSIGSPSYCSFYFILFRNKSTETTSVSTYTWYSDSVDVRIIFKRKLPTSAWIKGEIHFHEIGVRKTFNASAKEFVKQIECYNLCHNSDLEFFLNNSTCDVIIHCSMKISEREIKCAFDKEKVCYAESRNYDSSKDTVKHESFSDVSIVIDGHIFKTHKTLLARIPYFQELFDTNESEQQFELTNIEREIFNHMLTFLYSGDIPVLHFKLACELYIVANDLKICDLRNLCSSYLGANLTEINVVMVLKLAQEYEDITLKRECFKFIKKSDVEKLSEKSIVI